MGTDGGKFDVSDRITADRLNRKMLVADTGANLAALTPTPGQLAFCTSTGSGFAAGNLYQRNEGNTAWYIVINDSGSHSLSGKTITTDSNTIKHGTTNNTGDVLVNTGTKFDRKSRGSAHQVFKMNSGGTDSGFETFSQVYGRASVSGLAKQTGSLTFVDVTGITVTLNLVGGRAGVFVIVTGHINATGNDMAEVTITGSAALACQSVQAKGITAIPITVIAFDPAPATSSQTYKAQIKSIGGATVEIYNASIMAVELL